MKQEQIDVLKKLRDCADTSEACEALDAAIKELEWIPVSERLPEIGTRVLANTGLAIYELTFKGDGWDWGHTHQVYALDAVIHWRPLPEVE